MRRLGLPCAFASYRAPPALRLTSTSPAPHTPAPPAFEERGQGRSPEAGARGGAPRGPHVETRGPRPHPRSTLGP
ncbi:predicted protein [Streptomyces sp. SPB78]|nr:predicted protein [Streptomyces sp. SPB78]